MQFYFKNKITNILLVLSIGIFLFGTGYKLGEYKTSVNKVDRANYSVLNAQIQSKDQKVKNLDFSLFWETWNTVEQKFVDKKKLDPQKMFYGAIKGMVGSLEDPYTFFLTPEENKQTKDDLGGKFEGIGAQLGLKNGRITVIAPLKNSPAETAGVKAGDYVIKVNDQSTKNWALTKAVSQIRGKQGTKVRLGLERDGHEIALEIERKQINVPSIDLSYESKNNCQQNCAKVAYLKVNQFGDNTIEEWDKAIDDVQNKWEQKQIQGLLLDFRDNPGGYLDAAIYLASEFLPINKLVIKQESSVQKTKEYKVVRIGRLVNIPLSVLINKGSASASEIVSGSLRDYKRAKLIGEKSFGKGSVQEAVDLKTNAGLHVTIAKWILPKGDWINSKGITPDTEVKNVEDNNNTLTRRNDLQLEAAVSELIK